MPDCLEWKHRIASHRIPSMAKATKVDWQPTHTSQKLAISSNFATCNLRLLNAIEHWQSIAGAAAKKKKTGANETSYLIAVLAEVWQVASWLLFSIRSGADHALVRLAWPPVRHNSAGVVVHLLVSIASICQRVVHTKSLAWPIQYTLTYKTGSAYWPLGVFNRTKFQFEFHFLFRYAHLGFCLSNFCLLSLAFFFHCCFAIVFHFVAFCFQMLQAATMKTFRIERAF